MDSFAIYIPGELEVRQGNLGGPSINGTFNYNRLAVISDRQRVRKESMASHAFEFSINDTSREINILSGHDFDKVLAGRRAGSLEIRDTAEGVSFVANLPPLDDQPTYMVDAVKKVRAGLVGGLSPGFSVPPASAVPNAESIIPEPGNPSVGIRLIRAAVLHEFSLVELTRQPLWIANSGALSATSPARDNLQISTGLGVITLADRRFVVRNDESTWEITDRFTFEGGSYVIQGVSELLGRGRFLELLARG